MKKQYAEKTIRLLTEKSAMLSVDAVEPVIRKIPPALQRQVLKYIEMSLSRAQEKRHGTMKFAWAGGCADIKGDYISVQLQKKS